MGTRALAFLLCGLVLALFILLGAQLQSLNVAFGLWFTEVFIFLGVPWVGLRLFGRDPARFAGLAFPGWQAAGFGFLVGTVNLFAVIVPVQYLALLVAPDWLEEMFDPRLIFQHATAAELALIIGGVGLAAPLCEEYFFRGVFQRGLLTRDGPGRALWVTALVFSAFHLDPIGFPARLELGLVFGLLALRSGSIWPAVMAHAANNLVSSALYFAFGGEQLPQEETAHPLGVLFTAAIGLSALWALVRLARRRPELLSSPAPAAELELPRAAPVRVIAPWALSALGSVALWLAVDRRGAALARIDLEYRLPPAGKQAGEEEHRRREELNLLRQRVRQGEAPVSEYEEARQQAFQLLRDAGS